ncbi:hypothetical protein Peur_048478 [Populus x canadensis]
MKKKKKKRQHHLQPHHPTHHHQLNASFLSKFFVALPSPMVTFWLHGLYDPDWEFEVPSTHLFGYKSGTKTVNCGVKGSLEPPCNAVGLIDRFFLGEHPLYQHPVVNSPDYRTLVPDSPGWFLAPFDSKGILSFLMASITCFLGLQFGHILVHFKGHMQRLYLWSACSFTVHYWICVKTSW